MLTPTPTLPRRPTGEGDTTRSIMLTDIERIIFIVLSLFALGAAGFVARRIYRIIWRGQGALGTDHWERRVAARPGRLSHAAHRVETPAVGQHLPHADRLGLHVLFAGQCDRCGGGLVC